MSTSAVAPSRSLVIKGTDRIEAINVREDVRLEARLYTPTINRLLRRDFNLTSVKLFFYCKGGDFRKARAQHYLQDLLEEAAAVENQARSYEMPACPPLSVHTMRIISDEARMLFEALHVADRAIFKLQSSPMGEMIEETLIPFMRVYTTLRQKVFGFSVQARERRDEDEQPDGA